MSTGVDGASGTEPHIKRFSRMISDSLEAGRSMGNESKKEGS